MRIDILTACPELLESPLNHSIVQRAKDKGLVEIYVHNLRDFTLDKHRKIDDYAFGFGAGMVLQIEPIDRAISYLKAQRDYDEVIFTAPDGERFTQKEANTLSMKENIIILCGHYKGVDQRVRDHFITKEYTIGDFVLTGGGTNSGGQCLALVIGAVIATLLVGKILAVCGIHLIDIGDRIREVMVLYPPVALAGSQKTSRHGHQAKYELTSAGHNEKVWKALWYNGVYQPERKCDKKPNQSGNRAA